MVGTLGYDYQKRIVLLDEINTQRRNGISPYDSIIEATISRTRPVLMAATTTILGMVPLLLDVAFGGMAATIIFGLTFATLLTLFVTPDVIRIVLPDSFTSQINDKNGQSIYYQRSLILPILPVNRTKSAIIKRNIGKKSWNTTKT
mgnify:CR=1 FL=1